MKQLLSVLFICLFAVSVQAQTLFFSVDAGTHAKYVESTYIGFAFDTPSEKIGVHAFMGFSQNFAKGEYAGGGVGLEYLLPDPLNAFGASTPFGIRPITMGNIRAVFGQFDSDNILGRPESEQTVAYNVFLGLNYKVISIGASIDQYLNNKRVFVNPLSVRLSW